MSFTSATQLVRSQVASYASPSFRTNTRQERVLNEPKFQGSNGNNGLFGTDMDVVSFNTAPAQAKPQDNSSRYAIKFVNPFAQ